MREQNFVIMLQKLQQKAVFHLESIIAFPFFLILWQSHILMRFRISQAWLIEYVRDLVSMYGGTINIFRD